MFRKKFSSKLKKLDTLYGQTVSQLAIYVQVAYCEGLIKRCEEDLKHNIYEVSKEHTEAVKLAAKKSYKCLGTMDNTNVSVTKKSLDIDSSKSQHIQGGNSHHLIF